MKIHAALLAVGMSPALVAASANAAEPDDLKLPLGFHASVVAEGLGEAVRHMAFRDANRLYVSTERQKKDAPNVGIIALHLDGKHVADKTEHFSEIDNGTGIAFYKGALYTGSPDTLYRFKFKGNELVPSAAPEMIVSNLPGRAAIAFDDKNNLFIAAGGGGNVCAPPGTPRNVKSVGPRPCPVLETGVDPLTPALVPIVVAALLVPLDPEEPPAPVAPELEAPALPAVAGT